MSAPQFTVEKYMKPCGCRSAGECSHDTFAERDAIFAMVDAFAAEMKSKLLRKMMSGKYGWDDLDQLPGIRKSLVAHVAKGDPIDVANFAMMIWNFNADTMETT